MENTKKKILIVEDDEAFLWIIKQGFAGEGFQVVTAGNGEEGLKTAEEEKPELILLDIMMPKMNGIEMAKQMKVKGSKIPIIFLTNMSDLDHMTTAIEVTPADYIIKADLPIDKIIIRVKERLGIK